MGGPSALSLTFAKVQAAQGRCTRGMLPHLEVLRANCGGELDFLTSVRLPFSISLILDEFNITRAAKDRSARDHVVRRRSCRELLVPPNCEIRITGQ